MSHLKFERLNSDFGGTLKYIDMPLLIIFKYQMELRHLRYFAAVAAEEHVHRAAERLRIAQPALTQQIKALEREMGVQLFRREGRGITLTDVGRAFQIDVQSILKGVDLAVERARDIEAGRTGLIRIGFTDSASFHPVVTQVLKGLRKAWPDVECRLEEQHTEYLVAGLESGNLDAAFVRPPIKSSAAVSFQLLTREPLVVAMPADHPLSTQPSLSIAALKNESFVTYPRRNGPGLSEMVLLRCREAGFMPKIAQQTPQLSSTINFVAAGMGIAIVPASMRHQRAETLKFLPLTDLNLEAELGLATPSASTRAILPHLLKVVLEIIGDLGPLH